MATQHRTWENYQRFSIDRAKLVVEILEQFAPLAGKRILDFGCGRGSLARLLSQSGAMVTAVDIDPTLRQFFEQTAIPFYLSTQDNWLKSGYDLIVLQDALEHVVDPNSLFRALNEVLFPNGLLYISTPNRLSPFNFLSDPHWTLPVVASLPRPMVKFFVQKIFHRDPRQRFDWPALLSLGKLKQLFHQHGFELIFVNKFVAQKLFQCPSAVVCHPWHLTITQWLKQHHLHRYIIRWVNDRPGVFNWLINPTWYIIGRKK